MKDSTLDLLDSYDKWIENDKLDSVVSRIHYIYLNDMEYINGNILGLFAKRLIDSEIEVGGPYLSKDDIYTNILIRNLFRAMGAPLQNLEKYLSDKNYTAQNNTEKIALGLQSDGIINENKTISKKLDASLAMCREEMKNLDPELRRQGLTFLKKISKSDKRSEISQISTYVQKSLINSPNEENLMLSTMLGCANIYAWVAYTIYDDFIDDEGIPEKLSLANIMHRLSYTLYLDLFQTQKKIIQQHFNSVDNSNLLELKKCRAEIVNQTIKIRQIPNYGKGELLANRAVGHVLGPKLLIGKSGASPKQFSLLTRAFDQYLIAKQINDDLIDWRIDLRNGHLSYVSSKLLKNAGTKTGEYNIETLINHLKINLREHIYEESLEEIIMNLKDSQKNIDDSELFIKENLFTKNILQPLREEVELNLIKYRNEKQFLKYFS